MNILEEYTSINKQRDVEFRYSYRLIDKTFNNTTVYGVEVERKDYIGSRNIKLERDKIELISPQRYKVENMLFKLYQNQVSPIHLVDVLGQEVDGCVNDFPNF